MNPHNNIIKITILDELKRFIPPMLPHERASLERSILSEGCKTPLIVWRRQYEGKTELILVDGHNRKAICDKHNLPYHVEEKHFHDLGEVRTYMAEFQNARRNLNTLQRAYMIGAHYESLKQNALDNLKKRDAQAQVGPTGETTADFIARQYATSESTVKRFYNLFQAMRAIEQINENALMLCFQCFNAKETTFVEFVAKASQETIASIKDVTTLYETVKEGKRVVSEAKPKKKTKVQNEPSKSKEVKLNDTIYNQKRELEKAQKTIEQLTNKLAKQDETLLEEVKKLRQTNLVPLTEIEKLHQENSKPQTEILKVQNEPSKNNENDIDLWLMQYAIYNFNQEIQSTGHKAFQIFDNPSEYYGKWKTQGNTVKFCMSITHQDMKKIYLAYEPFLRESLNYPKVQNEPSEKQIGKIEADDIVALREELKGYRQDSISVNKVHELRKEGWQFYRLDLWEKRIKKMNENGAWTCPKELQYTTKAEAQRQFNELMKQTKNIGG